MPVAHVVNGNHAEEVNIGLSVDIVSCGAIRTDDCDLYFLLDHVYKQRGVHETI